MKTIITPEMFGAVGNGVADDAIALQEMLDNAVQTNAICDVSAGRRYRFTQPLLLKHGNFANHTVQIIGNGTFWDTQANTVFIYDGKAGAAINIQNGKGTVIEGITFIGAYKTPALNIYTTSWDDFFDPTITDAYDDPHCAIKVDGELTPNRSGSTGITIRNCAFRNFTGAINISPGGNLNAELIWIEGIKVNDCKYFLSGGQAQEKTNVVTRCGIWGNVHTVFVWSKYGQGHPGKWYAKHVNVAVAGNLLHRASQNFAPLTIDDLHAEALGSIGYWTTGKNMPDCMMNSLVQLISPSLAANNITLTGNNVMFMNTTFRYYNNANPPQPFLFKGEVKFFNSFFETNPVKGLRYYHTDPSFNKGFTIYGSQNYRDIEITDGITMVPDQGYQVGQTIVFYAANYDYNGMGQITQVVHGFATISYINLKSGKYRYGVYQQTQ